MKWKIVYYSNRVQKEILSLPKDLLVSFVAITEKMEMIGPHLGMPYTRAMGEGLFEIRSSSKDGIARVFYCTSKQNDIWILHSFIKKTEQTPKQELQLARKRLKEVKQYD